MADKKITKAEYFTTIKQFLCDHDADASLVAFVDTQLEQIAAKAVKAKSRAEEKKAVGDELRAAVQSVLTDTFQDIDSIMSQIDGEDLTPAKISNRLGALVRAGIAEKESQKNSEGKKCMVYRLISE